MNKSSIDEMQKLARSRGGECLSDDYINSITKLRWRCRYGHEWDATPGNIKSGHWCPVCANEHRNESRRLTIDDMQELARSRGGECLSTEYTNNSTKLRWRCRYGHEWDATPGNIKSGSWCPYCAGYYQTIDDMKKIASNRGGKCLSDKYINSATKLRWQCAYGHEWEATPMHIKSGQWCPTCADNMHGKSMRLTISEMHELARSRGGECLSTVYVDSKVKLRWRCQYGHEWNAVQASIKSGSWCPVCAKNKKLTITDMQELARNRGGECLSTDYINSFAKLRWRCRYGHEWNAVPYSIKAGTWCPLCADERRNEPRKLTIDEMREIARSRGGECLSADYIDSKTKLRWRCELGHEWNAIPNNIKSGHWCPICAHKKVKQ